MRMIAANNTSELDRDQRITNRASASGQNFDWPLANEAEALLRRQVEVFLEQNAFARQLSHRMSDETGTDFFEWIDHLTIAAAEEENLKKAGFVPDEHAETPHGEGVYEHPRATLPRVIIDRTNNAPPAVVALRPEYLADFMARHNLSREPEGEP